MTELLLSLGQANNIFDPLSEGEFAGSPPAVSVEAGSVQFTVGGGLFASGIALLAACSAGMVAAPAAAAASGCTLATAGFIELALNWREKIAQIRKTDAETTVLRLEHDHITVQQSQRLRELEIQAKELELEMARARAMETRDADEISSAGLVPRDVVRREAERLGLSEGYANYILNRTLPSYRKLAAYFSEVQVCHPDDYSKRKT
jgi:hypothetical protein